jgi:hypothetical protein
MWCVFIRTRWMGGIGFCLMCGAGEGGWIMDGMST